VPANQPPKTPHRTQVSNTSEVITMLAVHKPATAKQNTDAGHYVPVSRRLNPVCMTCNDWPLSVQAQSMHPPPNSTVWQRQHQHPQEAIQPHQRCVQGKCVAAGQLPPSKLAIDDVSMPTQRDCCQRQRLTFHTMVSHTVGVTLAHSAFAKQHKHCGVEHSTQLAVSRLHSRGC
jgi:hypothetical protein